MHCVRGRAIINLVALGSLPLEGIEYSERLKLSVKKKHYSLSGLLCIHIVLAGHPDFLTKVYMI